MRGLFQIVCLFALVALLFCQVPAKLFAFAPSVPRRVTPGAAFVELSSRARAACLARVQMPWQMQTRVRLVGVPRAAEDELSVAVEAEPPPAGPDLPPTFSHAAHAGVSLPPLAALLPPSFAAAHDAWPADDDASAASAGGAVRPRVPRAELLDLSFYPSLDSNRETFK